MKQSFFTKFISTILIVVIIASTSLAPKTAQADLTAVLGGTASGVVGTFLSSNCSGVQDTIKDWIGGIFSSVPIVGDIVGGDKPEISISNSVPVKDSEVRSNTEKIDENTKSIASKETCWDAVWTSAAKIVLAEFTSSVVNWINSGFNGSPLFLQNPKAFFKSIADQETSGLIDIIAFDDVNYPFGKVVGQSLIEKTQGYFETNAQYTLDRALAANNPGVTRVEFLQDFKVGGWSAFFDSVIFPQNNPVGFYQMTTDELSGRLVGTNDSLAEQIKDQLNHGNGLLDFQKCVDPMTYNKDSDKAVADAKNALANPDDTLSDTQIANYYKIISDNTCKRFETQTPGMIIADQITTSLSSPQRQLELADEMNESLSAIFDALINQLVGYGLKSLQTDSGADASGVYGSGYGQNSSTNASGGGSWYSAPTGEINLVTDLDEIIDIQKKFAGQSTNGTDPLPGFDGIPEVLESLTTLITDTKLADYCIPGPRPNWASNAVAEINQAIEVNSASSLFNPKLAETLSQAYDEYYARITGTPYDALVGTDQIHIDTYGYTLANLPTSAGQIFTEANKIPNYESESTSLTTKLATMTSLITQLELFSLSVQAIANNTSLSEEVKQVQLDALLQVYNAYLPNIETFESLLALQSDALLYESQDDYVRTLLSQCSSEINNPSILATLHSKGLDNWMPYPGIFQYNTKITPPNTYNAGLPLDAWLVSNTQPYFGVTLPYPNASFTFGATGACVPNLGGTCWFTATPQTLTDTGHMLATDSLTIDSAIWKLNSWFAEFEERTGIY